MGLVHIAMGSFLSLQAYYGSTFVDGTGAVVGVGLLRNLGGMMSGLIFAGILAARMIPELRILSRHVSLERARAGRTRFDRDRGAQPRSDVDEVRLGRSPSSVEPAGRPANRRGCDRLLLALAMGDHGRHGGRLARRRSR